MLAKNENTHAESWTLTRFHSIENVTKPFLYPNYLVTPLVITSKVDKWKISAAKFNMYCNIGFEKANLTSTG
jgi:hypothetical protein